MTLLEGEHVSSDVAVVQGRAALVAALAAAPQPGRGTFDYWTIEAEARPDLEAYLAAWLARHLGAYTGMLNFETIGGRIIDAHLRFADQWPDLYGRGWLDAVVGLYQHGELDVLRLRAQRRVQRGAVRSARARVPPSARGTDRAGARACRR